MPTGPNAVVQHRQPVREVDLPRKPIEECKIHFSEHQYNILVEIVADHPGDSSVSPASMDQEQSVEVSELADSIVSTPDSLTAFFASDAHSDVCFEDHAHVVGSIAN